ncbi:hypothetical protein M407DRAFT_5667 [Tulasnella calospora MUT 4182]|uniref:GST N-terminal domain-containing protein n=1 Tax=Tulasnella calospora MUT 4182 TaxID=1051891 RepID=A0A0C3QRN5_9AGAM|nr:hypothetical protein M407DRAFT_5667 [Tulasnella calospora MUT 4182]
MSAGKLHTVAGQPTGNRIKAVAAFGGVQIESDESWEFGVTNKSPEWLAKFPYGKIPAFECASGLNLYETIAIARYIASLSKNSLLGTTPEEAAQVDQWVSFGDTELFANGSFVRYMLNGKYPYSKPIDNYYRERNARSLKCLESHLANRTYLVSERITLADISVASVLKVQFSWLVDTAERAALPNTVRFFETVSNQPAIKAVWGDSVYVDKAPQYCKFKYNEELTLTFMSSNQIGGFFNRLEASRKYLFGSMGVLGEPNNSVIAGCFICRGPEYKPVLDVAPDWESYDFEPVNLENEADKAYFEAALAWDLEIDGKKWADGKNTLALGRELSHSGCAFGGTVSSLLLSGADMYYINGPRHAVGISRKKP